MFYIHFFLKEMNKMKTQLNCIICDQLNMTSHFWYLVNNNNIGWRQSGCHVTISAAAANRSNDLSAKNSVFLVRSFLTLAMSAIAK